MTADADDAENIRETLPRSANCTYNIDKVCHLVRVVRVPETIAYYSDFDVYVVIDVYT